jgi:hypothetical protein
MGTLATLSNPKLDSNLDPDNIWDVDEILQASADIRSGHVKTKDLATIEAELALHD